MAKKDLSKREKKKAEFEKDVQKTVSTRIGEAMAPEKEATTKAQESSRNFSFDIKHPENWDTMTSEQQNKWNAQNKHKIIAEPFAQKFDEIQKAYSPSQKQPPQIDKEKFADLERKKRKRKWLDIAVGVLGGIQGQPLDRSQLPTNILEAKQEAMLKDYKDTVRKNREAVDAWNKSQHTTRMQWLQDAWNRAQTPEEKEMYQAEMKLANKRVSKPRSTASAKPKPIYTHQTDGGSWKMTNQRNPYSDLYYKLTGSSPTILNEFAKISGYQTDPKTGQLRDISSAEQEQLANTLLSKAFEIQVDEDGNRIAVPKPGKEDFLQTLSSAISSSQDLQNKKEALNREMEDELRNFEGSWFKTDEQDKAAIRKKYAAKIEEIDNQIKQSSSSLESILNNKKTTPKKAKQSKSSVLDDIYNQ